MPIKEFEIRPYGKTELAMRYFPNAKTKKGALNNLNYWISYNGELRRRLREMGMPSKARHFTAREVAIIVECLCEP